MKSILENHEFLLGVEEKWDLYYEVTVVFIKEVAVENNNYHVFVDKKNEKYYRLKPRYTGHQIEGIFVEKKIIVNIHAGDFNPGDNDFRNIKFRATGVLQSIDR